MSRSGDNKLSGPPIEGGEPLDDDLNHCDWVWARLLRGQRYECVKLKPSYAYQPGMGDNVREI